MVVLTLCFLVLVVCVLITVSFFTLYERKILSLTHIRLGPTVVGWFGLLQPFSDAVKLFSKEITNPKKGNVWGVAVWPVLAVTTSIVSLSLIPWPTGFLSSPVLFVVLLVVTSVAGMLHLGVGWSSNSSYAMIGALRCLAQGVSYEVSLAVLFVFLCILVGGVDVYALAGSLPRALLVPPLCALWLISALAETNRSPFDFAEGESELVSGFNVEYGSVAFALLFIAEYTSMVFMSLLSSYILIGSSPVVVVVSALFFMYAFVWARASYPRTRYDKLMGFCWVVSLPCVLCWGLLVMAMI